MERYEKILWQLVFLGVLGILGVLIGFNVPAPEHVETDAPERFHGESDAASDDGADTPTQPEPVMNIVTPPESEPADAASPETAATSGAAAAGTVAQ